MRHLIYRCLSVESINIAYEYVERMVRPSRSLTEQRVVTEWFGTAAVADRRCKIMPGQVFTFAIVEKANEG
jgi:hypothetical protein